MTGTRTRDQAVEQAAEAFAEGLVACAQMTPREQAEAAWSPTSRLSLAELEDRIRKRRGLPALHRVA